MFEDQVKIVYLSIGSNLGNKKKNIELAKCGILNENIKIIKSASNYESLSWPNNNKPKFINTVIKIQTILPPDILMNKCLKIESNLGRVRKKKNEPRICDIDIIDYDQKIIITKTNEKLIIPHPHMHKRNFVLLPFFELNKRWIHPVIKKGIKKLIYELNFKELSTIKII